MGERVYNHATKREYERVGMFLVSDKDILGPRITIIPHESGLYKTIEKLINHRKYRELEEFLGIKIARDSVNIREDKVSIKREKDKNPQPLRHKVKLGRKEIEFELYNKYYAFLPNATIILNTDIKPMESVDLYYYQNNLTFTSALGRIPEPIDEMIANGELYEKIFNPLGIPEDAEIEMHKKCCNEYIIASITAEVGEKKVKTSVRFDANFKKVKDIRVLGWPFVEGVYSFTIPIGKEVDLSVRSVSGIRKKVTKISKIFGPPYRTRIGDEWKIEYDHFSQEIKYVNGPYKVIFNRNGEITFESPSVRKDLEKENAEPILQTVFETPEVIELL